MIISFNQYLSEKVEWKSTPEKFLKSVINCFVSFDIIFLVLDYKDIPIFWNKKINSLISYFHDIFLMIVKFYIFDHRLTLYIFCFLQLCFFDLLFFFFLLNFLRFFLWFHLCVLLLYFFLFYLSIIVLLFYIRVSIDPNIS